MGWTVLGVLLTLAFLPVIVGRATLLPIQSGVMPDGPWGYTGPRPGPAVFDPAASAIKYVPVIRLVSAEWRSGRLPFWNPYAGGGVPLWANPESFASAPLRIPLYLAPAPATWNAYWLGRLWLAGGFTFLLASRIGLSFIPAITAGAAFMLGGYMVISLNLFHLDVDVLLPGLLLAVDVLLLSPSIAAFLSAALVCWFMCLGGGPQALLVDMLMVAAWAAMRALTTPPRGGRAALLPAALALAAGAAGAMVQWIPLFEFASRSHHLHSLEGGRSGLSSVGILALRHLVLPWKWESTLHYAGASVMVLAAAGAAAGWRAVGVRLVPFRLLTIVAVAEAAKIAGVPGTQFLGHIPLLEYVWWPKYAAPLFLSLALLAGLGAESLSGLAGKHRGLAAAVLASLVWAELAALRPGPLPRPFDPLAPAPYIKWLQDRQAEEPEAFLCGVRTALMPLTATAFRLKDIRLEDTLIDREQYRRLFDGISAPKPPKMSMFITLDELTRERLDALRNFGVRWLVADRRWQPREGLARGLSLAYDAEVRVYRLAGSTAFPGFPQRGKRALWMGLWITCLATPLLLAIGAARSARPRRGRR